MIKNVNINDLHSVLVHRVYNNICINMLPDRIIKDNIYNARYIQHLLCNLLHVPHIPYINGNKTLYINYMKYAGEYAGFGIEHSFEKFNNLIKNFKYLQKPYENEYIICKKMFNKLVIVDGLHRSSILKTLNKTHINIKIIAGV